MITCPYCVHKKPTLISNVPNAFVFSMLLVSHRKGQGIIWHQCLDASRLSNSEPGQSLPTNKQTKRQSSKPDAVHFLVANKQPTHPSPSQLTNGDFVPRGRDLSVPSVAAAGASKNPCTPWWVASIIWQNSIIWCHRVEMHYHNFFFLPPSGKNLPKNLRDNDQYHWQVVDVKTQKYS